MQGKHLPCFTMAPAYSFTPLPKKPWAGVGIPPRLYLLGSRPSTLHAGCCPCTGPGRHAFHRDHTLALARSAHRPHRCPAERPHLRTCKRPGPAVRRPHSSPPGCCRGGGQGALQARPCFTLSKARPLPQPSVLPRHLRGQQCIGQHLPHHYCPQPSNGVSEGPF